MELGNKIFELRKKLGLSQEDLAGKVDVTRQTISNWELNQTAPDIIQAKKLAQVFQVSLDELLDNDVQNVIIEKLNNTEKTTTKTTKVLKRIGIVIIVCIISTNLFLIKAKKSINELKQYEEEFDPCVLVHQTKIKFKLNECEYVYDFSFNESSNGVWYFPKVALTDIIGEPKEEDYDFIFHFNDLELVKKYGMEPLKFLDYLKNSFVERGATYEILEEKVEKPGIINQ